MIPSFPLRSVRLDYCNSLFVTGVNNFSDALTDAHCLLQFLYLIYGQKHCMCKGPFTIPQWAADFLFFGGCCVRQTFELFNQVLAGLKLKQYPIQNIQSHTFFLSSPSDLPPTATYNQRRWVLMAYRQKWPLGWVWDNKVTHLAMTQCKIGHNISLYSCVQLTPCQQTASILKPLKRTGKGIRIRKAKSTPLASSGQWHKAVFHTGGTFLEVGLSGRVSEAKETQCSHR